MDLSEVLWADVEEKLYITKDEYFARLEGWKIDGVYQDGELICVTTIKGPEFHFCLTGKCKRVTMAQIKMVTQPVLDEYGYLLTRTPKYEERQHRFNRVCGFYPVGEDEFNIHYRLDGWGRRGVCPS